MRTPPSLLFLLEKMVYAVMLDAAQVVDETGIIAFLVAGVELLQALAGKITALMAEPDGLVAQCTAESSIVRAALTAGDAARAARIFLVSLAFKVPAADSAVHAARRDEVGMDIHVLRYPQSI